MSINANNKNSKIMRQSDHAYFVAPNCVANNREVTAETKVVVPKKSKETSFSRRGRESDFDTFEQVHTVTNDNTTTGSCRKKHQRHDRLSVNTPPSSGAQAAAIASAPPPKPAYMARF
jgi:hypothetical protein